ncbi:MAG TPA: Rnase Y domain-containing protein, partial [Gemmatimonadales bacterium]|nr:Rnase Y domain-containing protein [Gemmatimonadales bacterium]
MAWLGIVVAVFGGALAAGTAFYFVGRRLGRRAADAIADAARREHERLLDETRQRLALEGKAELLKAREHIEQDVAGRRAELDRQRQNVEQKFAAIEDRQRDLGRQEQGLRERERALGTTEQEVRAKLERI